MTIFGESHGPMIGCVLDGLPAGFEISLEQLKADMDKRKAKGDLSTRRQEGDEVRIVSGFSKAKPQELRCVFSLKTPTPDLRTTRP